MAADAHPPDAGNEGRARLDGEDGVNPLAPWAGTAGRRPPPCAGPAAAPITAPATAGAVLVGRPGGGDARQRRRGVLLLPASPGAGEGAAAHSCPGDAGRGLVRRVAGRVLPCR